MKRKKLEKLEDKINKELTHISKKYDVKILSVFNQYIINYYNVQGDGIKAGYKALNDTKEMYKKNYGGIKNGK